LQQARYTVSSRTIDEAHRPRIVRRAAVAPALRALPAPIINRRRHRRPKLGLVLGAALAGWATVLPVSTPRWPVLIALTAAPTSAPLPSGNAPPADSVIVPVPVAASAAAEPTPDSAATASGGVPSPVLDALLAMTAAAETPATGTSLPVAAGLEAAPEPPKPLLDDRARPRPEAPAARARQSASSAVARAAPRESAWHRHIVLQLSSYADQARARQAAEALHRSLQKILKGAALRTEEAEVHGRRVWRVVAGPVADRERGKRLCEAVQHVGQSCVVMLL
jgi:hypothetical protein